jgi:hypothetical protein
MSPSSSGTAMTLAHVAAAAVSAWWLRRGERAVWGLARRIAAGILRPARGLLIRLPVRTALRVPAAPVAASRPHATVLRHAVVRRGPPTPSPALA